MVVLVGEFDVDIQTYIRALRKAGTPVSVPVVLAATEGVITAKNRSALLKYGGYTVGCFHLTTNGFCATKGIHTDES